MSDITCCLKGPGKTPIITVCGNDYLVKSGTFIHIPRKKAVTEKRSLSNQRRRQISWDPEKWAMTVVACSLAAKEVLKDCYQSETYQSYVFTFSYQYDYGGGYSMSQQVTFDEFDPKIVQDHPDRWDIDIELTEWL